MSYKLYNRCFADIWKRLGAFRTSLEIDEYIKLIYTRYGFKSAPYSKNFPGFSCITVNNVVCHGIPSKKPFAHGDIVSIDISVYTKSSKRTMFYDSARCFCVFNGNSSVKEIRSNPYVRLMISLYRHHFLMEDYFPKLYRQGTLVSHTNNFAARNGLKIFRDFAGHHIGRELWMKPNISYSERVKRPEEDVRFKPDTCFTHEPIFSKEVRYMFNSNKWMTHNKEVCFAVESMFYIRSDMRLKRLTTYSTLPYVIFWKI